MESSNNSSKAELEKQGADNNISLDVLTSIILIFISAIGIVLSIEYFRTSGEKFYASPGFMPTIICSVLILLNLIQLVRSLKTKNLIENMKDLKKGFLSSIVSKDVHKMNMGILAFAIYIFILLGNLPFWLASFIVLFAVLMFLKFDKTIKSAFVLALIASLSIGAIIILFQVTFKVPMP